MFGFFKKQPAEPPKVDLATVDTPEKARALHRAGALEKLFMRPTELGGDDNPLNTLYVPPAIARRKREIDLHVIQPLVNAGQVARYSASPEYEGNSVVPIAINITASGAETYRFTINVWGSALDRPEKEFDKVYAARQAAYAEHFGTIEGDVQKLMNLTGIWPGGCLVQIHAPQHQVWVTSSFGLTNPDMPATAKLEQYSTESAPDGRVAQYKMRIAGRPPRAVPASRAGYGYEILLFTRSKENWPLMFLNWAVQSEILQDASILDRVHKYGAMTVESVSTGVGRSADFLIAPLQQFAPSPITLPNGSMEVLAATLITREQMQFGIDQGGRVLLEQIMARELGQISGQPPA